MNLLIRPNGALSRSSASAGSMSALLAQKRRRRKTPPTPDSITPLSSDELPDFDDGEEEAWEDSIKVTEPTAAQASKATTIMASTPSSTTMPATKTKTITPIKRGAGLNANLAEQVGGNVDGLDEDVILEAMRGKAGGENWLPPRSVQDTISDRSLEKLMDFETMIKRDGGGGVGDGSKVDLPDFDEVIARRKQREAIQEGRVQDAAMLIDTEGMGKKAAKNAQRRAAALQRETEMEDQKASPFEDMNIFKLLENGAWVGIGLLVLWEFYINSPLFDRAAPLIPVVYDDIKPPGM